MSEYNPCQASLELGYKLAKETSTPLVDSKVYARMVEKPLFLTLTRADIACAMNLVLQFMQKSQLHHLQAVKHIIRYMKGTIRFSIKFLKNSNFELTNYNDTNNLERKPGF